MELISSRNNTKIVNAAKLHNKKYRKATSLFCFEGYKVFCEALASGIPLKEIFVREDVLTKYYELENLDCVYAVTDSVYEKLSSDQSPDGIFCVAHIPEQSQITDGSKMLISSVRDPGNIGTIIRTALAFGIDELILSDDCADIYSPKVVRSAMGALFKQTITVSSDIIGEIDALRKNGYRVYATALSKRSVLLSEIEIGQKTCFVIGNEGHGLDSDVIDACNGQIIIPISESSESLNAAIAASVLMWEMKRNS